MNCTAHIKYILFIYFLSFFPDFHLFHLNMYLNVIFTEKNKTLELQYPFIIFGDVVSSL